MAEQKQDDQLEHTYMRTTGCILEDLPEAMNDRVRVAREGSGISVLAARHDDDDDDDF